jgi:hypothetical protein
MKSSVDQSNGGGRSRPHAPQDSGWSNTHVQIRQTPIDFPELDREAYGCSGHPRCRLNSCLVWRQRQVVR